MSQRMELQEKEKRVQRPAHAREFVPSPKWVRVYFGGKFIADSKNVILLRQEGGPPEYYFPAQDVHMKYLQANDQTAEVEGLGETTNFAVTVNDHTAQNAAWRISQPKPNLEKLDGYIAFKWDKMDAWFEEDEEVFVHPHDPYSRLDIRHSSRHIRVVVGGETVAESDHPVLLFETGLPVRYYIPKMDVRMDLLEPSETHSECPYKGVASYYSVRIGDEVAKDIAWYYPFPYPEVGKIQNMIAFYDEKVDAVYIDGEAQAKSEVHLS